MMELELENAKPALILAVGFIVFSLMVTVGLSRLDAVNHYYYVGFLQKECWGSNPESPNGNPDKICIDLWNNLGIPVGDQANIPNMYNQSLNQNLYIIAGAFGGLWILITVVIAMIRDREPEYFMGIFTTIVIMTTIALPALTGWGDYFYFYWLGLPEPSSWSWLDGLGVFPFIMHFTGDAHVMLNDMYYAMIIGISVPVILWSIVILIFMNRETRLIDLL